MTDGPVLITGAFGLVGSALVRHLLEEGRHVVATDLGVPENRRKAKRLRQTDHLEVRWADLTDDAALDSLLGAVAPGVVVHLAAVIPPLCYGRRERARRVNVEVTRALVRSASALDAPPRFVLASSVAVYGPRNPFHHSDLLTAATPVQPGDLYGAHKAEAEEIVTSSTLTWVILRLGGVLTPEVQSVSAAPILDNLYLEGLLPSDGRLQTVDVRDVARAFSAATTCASTGEIFLVGGDGSHRISQAAIGAALAEAMGLGGTLPVGRPGNPESDRDWFATDWMDTTRSQQVLSFQHHSLPQLVADTRAKAGWRRPLLRATAPLVRRYLHVRAPYRDIPGRYADPWSRIARRWGDPAPEVGQRASENGSVGKGRKPYPPRG